MTGLPAIPVVLSTSSVYPDRTTDAFEAAARLGYDGLEVMVYTDPVSQSGDALARLVDYHQVPVLAVHAPGLLLTQLVWGREPWSKLMRAKDLAERLGAKTIVVHPPFRWQREYTRGFEQGIQRMSQETDVVFAVENMFPIRAGANEVSGYTPHWDPTKLDVPTVTLDLSHTAASASDALAMAGDLGGRLRHIHLADGTGVSSGPVPDEHLVPGRGKQPCAEVLNGLASGAFNRGERYNGMIVAEVNTRRAANKDARLADLAETLAFARKHLNAVPAALFPALASGRSGPPPPPSSLSRSFLAPSLLGPGAGARPLARAHLKHQARAVQAEVSDLRAKFGALRAPGRAGVRDGTPNRLSVLAGHLLLQAGELL